MSIALKHWWNVVWVCCALFLSYSSVLNAEDHTQMLLAHYMLWYSSKPISGNWGWHWTMNRFEPDKVLKDGRREIASHDYPLIGPYDSADPHVLECHVLLMKFSGIDGVIIDWYGIEEFYDYAQIHQNTKKLIRFIKKAGLRFAVCYEDQSVGHMVEGGLLRKEDAVAHGKKVIEWLDKEWFGDNAYVKIEGRPVLLVFGPQYFVKREQWFDLMSGLSKPLLLYALPHRSKEIGADGTFVWPPVAGGKKLSPVDWRSHLTKVYARRATGESVIAVIFPGFNDIYSEAGLHESYGQIDDREGKTFEETFDLALNSESQIIQIATWNDFGEGTVIEPTKRFGYRYLEIVQRHTRTRPRLRFDPDDLRLPVILYELRKSRAGDEGAKKDLDRASALLFASKCGEARKVLEKHLPTSSKQAVSGDAD